MAILIIAPGDSNLNVMSLALGPQGQVAFYLDDVQDRLSGELQRDGYCVISAQGFSSPMLLSDLCSLMPWFNEISKEYDRRYSCL